MDEEEEESDSVFESKSLFWSEVLCTLCGREGGLESVESHCPVNRKKYKSNKSTFLLIKEICLDREDSNAVGSGITKWSGSEKRYFKLRGWTKNPLSYTTGYRAKELKHERVNDLMFS